MIDKVLASLRATIELSRHDFMRNCGTAALATLFGLASLGFGAFAAFLLLSASFGGAMAAMILCSACAAIVVALVAIPAWRRKKARLRRAAMAAASAPPQSLASLFEGLLAAGALGDQKNLLAVLRLGRKLTSLDLVALALFGGFIASRQLGK